MQKTQALDEIVEFIAKEIPEKVLSFKAPEKTKTRVFDLLFKQRNDELNEAESAELNHYLVLEHLMRLAKAKAYQLLNV